MIINLILSIVWLLYSVYGIINNYQNYSVLDWLIISILALSPIIIVSYNLITKHESKKIKLTQTNMINAFLIFQIFGQFFLLTVFINQKEYELIFPITFIIIILITILCFINKPQFEIKQNTEKKYIKNKNDHININILNDMKRILIESMDLSLNSNNIEVVVSRMRLGQEKYISLQQYEKNGLFIGEPSLNYFYDFFFNSYNQIIYEAINRNFNIVKDSASKLKTLKGQQANITRFFENLSHQYSYFNYDLINYCNTLKVDTLNELQFNKLEDKTLSDFTQQSMERSETFNEYHLKQLENLNFSNISVNYNSNVELTNIEKSFLKYISGLDANKLSVPGYWTHEHRINYQEVISKFIANDYLIIDSCKPLETFKVIELKELLKNYNLKVSGTKAELINRLLTELPKEYIENLTSLGSRYFHLTDKGKLIITSIYTDI